MGMVISNLNSVNYAAEIGNLNPNEASTPMIVNEDGNFYSAETDVCNLVPNEAWPPTIISGNGNFQRGFC